MNGEPKTALFAFLANIVLFFLKISAAATSGSLAVLSSAFDSLNDIISYLVGYYSIKESVKGPDRGHPFGHRRLEPIASMIIAIFTGILAFEILRSVTTNLLSNAKDIVITEYVFLVLSITIITKLVMYVYINRKAKLTMSTALEAMAADSRNDVLSNLVAIIGVFGVYLGEALFDDAAAVFIALYIAYSGFRLAKKNFNFMVGARPPQKVLDAIRKKATVSGVKRIGRVRAHYVGDRVHAEVEIVLDKSLKGPDSHDIGVRAQKSVEHLKIVGRAFIHIDYA